MGYLGPAVFLLGIELTRQFRHIPRDHRERTGDDYVRCTTETIEKLRGETPLETRDSDRAVSVDGETTSAVKNIGNIRAISIEACVK